MRAPTASELLETWENGLTQPPVWRALELLSVVHPQASPDQLLAITIGRRDADLFALRRHLFGPIMEAVALCPECGGRLDLTLNATDILSLNPSEPASEMTLSHAGYQVQFRCPNSEDMVSALRESDYGSSCKCLLERCLQSVEYEGRQEATHLLPERVVTAVMESMAKADPAADIQLAVCCPACNHHWRAAFDIVSFLWREIESLAGRLMREVHTLASAYGWREQDILALSSVRREFYLASLGG